MASGGHAGFAWRPGDRTGFRFFFGESKTQFRTRGSETGNQIRPRELRDSAEPRTRWVPPLRSSVFVQFSRL